MYFLAGGEIIKQHFRIGTLAARAGVTLRTLRYYDKIGLLKPSGRSEAGQRLYSELDVARLQQILTLKLIGLSLDEIQHLLTTDTAQIQHLLERQKRVLQTQVRQLERVVHTIEAAQRTLQVSQRLDLEGLINIIKAVNMNTQADWLTQLMSNEQVEKLADMGKNWTLAQQKQAGEAWKSLFREVQASLDKDVRDPAVQALVDRLDDLMADYTQGDADFAATLTGAYAHLDSILDAENLPPDVRQWVTRLQDAAAFMERARATRDT